ncbi:hypothetical protein Dda_9309 [Drechslerella dactyloides]|uniref:Uncharacterized protein n=1 Tax=Drechslerella dactyloides TaxID=74499 RepID=A0AAD6NF85_DREDA|nr:hypothetical protein Dda_9309 [Drechslerella dactyloides]
MRIMFRGRAIASIVLILYFENFGWMTNGLHLPISTIYQASSSTTPQTTDTLITQSFPREYPTACNGNCRDCTKIEILDYNIFIGRISKEDALIRLCEYIANSTCSPCIQRGGTRTWINYVLRTCDSSSSEPDLTAFKGSWRIYTNLSDMAYQEHLDLFPWNWRIRYNASLDQRSENNGSPSSPPDCSSTFGKLFPLLVAEVVVLGLTLSLGRRDVLCYISGHRLGNPAGSPWWPLTATLFTAISICSNLLAASLVSKSPGYRDTPFTELLLLWSARPRLGWVAGCFILVQREKSIYFSTGASAMFSELVLQAVGAHYLVKTVNYGAQHSYFLPSTEGIDGGRAARVMFIGALIWVISAGLIFFTIAWSFIGLGKLCQRLGRASRAYLRRLRGVAVSAGSEVERDKRARSADIKFVPFETLVGRMTRTPPVIPRLPLFRNAEMLVPPKVSENSTALPVEVVETRTNSEQEATPADGVVPVPVEHEWKTVLENMGLNEAAAERIRAVVFWIMVPFIGQLMFWGGYVALAQDFYCPPNRLQLLAVWSGVGIVGGYWNSSDFPFASV